MNTNRAYSDRPVPTYVIIGTRLHIHFNEVHEQREDMGEIWDIYSYNEAVCHVNDDRETLIVKILQAGATQEQAEQLADGRL